VVNVVAAQNPGSHQPAGVGSISCAMVNSELHVICVDSAGVAWHTIRRIDGSWFPFVNVMQDVLRWNPGSTLPGSIVSIAVADSF
jgi:hypothetical protein